MIGILRLSSLFWLTTAVSVFAFWFVIKWSWFGLPLVVGYLLCLLLARALRLNNRAGEPCAVHPSLDNVAAQTIRSHIALSVH
jgi:hypothetical protein